ncbi:hypothetical protein PAXRUDRAFT_34216 [Paxillus rubicundulus Ve08.2h10]|uniref:Probable RNA-binding protein 18 n=1 Tax=Paxillus rubicundulus Ve08.2h10 TaxID=930991 RepID=A0A0D0E639_9AGAM|nr:hypothetical protein PAXRUDRAFT_34216 [Paxillus rubicundulus Ve08.2h10]
MGTHLWIPEPETKDPSSDQAVSPPRLPQLLRGRLYVGNLSPTVDEFSLLQVFSKFGHISKLDFLFHKSGPNKGKPRGYAFIEFSNEADIEKALKNANGKLLRGRKLFVTFAQQAPHNASGSITHGGKAKRVDTTPTALSLAKSSGFSRPEARTSSKIAMMEAKLRQMGSSSPFAEKSFLPSKPITQALCSDVPKGSHSRRAPPVLMHTGSAKGLGIQRPVTGVGSQLSLPPRTESSRAAPQLSIASESADASRVPPSSKQRSIPGVKIVKGRLK